MRENKPIVIGEGAIGGKGTGILKLMEAVSSANLPDVTFPKTYFIATGVFDSFFAENRLTKFLDAPHDANINAILNGDFSSSIKDQFLSILKDINGPLAIRSSSLLEDQKGFSFAGKYESCFVGTSGKDRLQKFMEAVKKVYASTFNKNALTYRAKHGFLEETEKMGVVVQEIVGQRYQNYFLPAMAGVAFSQNGYCWNKEIKKTDGLVRLVMGLGTRAVGRGYVRLFSPAKPSMRPEGTEVNNIQKCSQKNVDVIDLESGEFKTVHFRELVTDGFNCFPGSQAFVSLRDGTYLYKPVSNLWDSLHVPVLTMDGALSSPWMELPVAETLENLLKKLETAFGYAVDIEFAIKTNDENKKGLLYLLQARPLSMAGEKTPKPIPTLQKEKLIFTASRNLPTAHVPNIEYLVYIDETLYHKWPLNDRQSVARVVGKLNEVLKGRRFVLIGPGRWGSWNPELGVPVNYAEISNCSLLVEVARRTATYVPEVSYGSHFFQDLIEDNIAYLPLYPHEPNEFFNEGLLSQKSVFSSVLTDPYYRKYDDLIRVIGVKAEAILNGEEEKAVVFLL